MVLQKVTCAPELVYTWGMQPTAYADLSIALFVSGYLAVMEMEKQSIKPLMAHHLQELLADVDLRGWDPVWSEFSGTMQRPSFSFTIPWSCMQPPLRPSQVWWTTHHNRRKQERRDQPTTSQQSPALKSAQLSIKGIAHTRPTTQRSYRSVHIVWFL